MRPFPLVIAVLLASCLGEDPSPPPIERAGHGVAGCLNILNENQTVYKDGNLFTFVVRGRDPACRYILQDNFSADTIDAVYYRGIECLEHFSSAYLFFRYRIYTNRTVKVSISDGVQGVAFGLGGASYPTLEKLSLQYVHRLSVNDSFPGYSCSQ